MDKLKEHLVSFQKGNCPPDGRENKCRKLQKVENCAACWADYITTPQDKAPVDVAREVFTKLEEHNAGWDGISVNAYWVEKIKEAHGVSDIPTRKVE